MVFPFWTILVSIGAYIETSKPKLPKFERLWFGFSDSEGGQRSAADILAAFRNRVDRQIAVVPVLESGLHFFSLHCRY